MVPIQMQIKNKYRYNTLIDINKAQTEIDRNIETEKKPWLPTESFQM